MTACRGLKIAAEVTYLSTNSFLKRSRMPKPVLQSLILADHVYEDKLTGKRIIAGVFNRIIRGVRVIKQVGPAAPTPTTSAPTFQMPTAPQPPTPAQQDARRELEQFNEPPQLIHPGQPIQSPPAVPAFAPPPTAMPPVETPPSQSPPAAPSYEPPPAQAAPPSNAQPSYAPQPQSPTAMPPPAAPATPGAHAAQTEYSSPTSRTGQHPVQPPLQPGQRVLEIPPTGLQSGSPFAYLSLTDVRGPNTFMLQLVSLADDSQLFRSDLRVDCPDPLLTVEVTVPLPPIAPPNAGIYALELLHNNEILGSLRIIVEDAPQ
jgi:hypothetical protein